MQQRVMRAASAVAILLATLVVGCRPEGPTATVQTSRGPARVALEVARTPEQLTQGLMYRNSLPDDRGMLFVFPREADHHFWMKNTLISLDMLFIGADGRIVGIHADATPLSTAQISVGQPSRYVLEVPGGWAARRGVAAGDRVELAGVAP